MAKSFDPIQKVDSKVGKNDKVSFALNALGLHALGYTLPPAFFYKHVQTIEKPERKNLDDTSLKEIVTQAPLTFRREDGTDYDFPIDPVISVSGKNVITRRYVAKGSMNGTVKESWSQDDWEVTIAGMLIGETADELHELMQDLREVLESGEVLGVANAWLNDGYGITQLVIDSWQFPHTKGITNQSYTIRCYSDTSVNILEEQ